MKAALALIAVATIAAAPPRRVVTLDLCADELVLAVAAPGQIASVTWLAADRHESALAPRAAGLHHNHGRIEDVVALRPDLVITSGAATRYAAEFATRIGARLLALPPVTTIAAVRANIVAVGQELGRPAAAAALIARFDRDLGPPRLAPIAALMLQGGGYAPAADGLAAAYLARAGLAQIATPGGRADLETLIARPPAAIVTTRYRAGQTSRGGGRLTHPALARLPASTRRLSVDGRGWTCLGPLAAATLPGLRAALATPR